MTLPLKSGIEALSKFLGYSQSTTHLMMKNEVICRVCKVPIGISPQKEIGQLRMTGPCAQLDSDFALYSILRSYNQIQSQQVKW
jgi:hypothetical protein